MTKRRPYLCPDGSEPCGRNGYCGHCPHDKNTKAKTVTTDNTAVIRQLEREVDLLRDKYRTEQSLRAQEERGRIEAQTQLEHIRRGADMYGVMQSMALQGKKHPKEPPMDGRLDAIRSLVAHNAKLVAELAEMQRLYERATKQAMEAERRAEKWEKSARRVQKENFRLMGMEPNQ